MQSRLVSQYSLFYGSVTNLYASCQEEIVHKDKDKIQGGQFPLLFDKVCFLDDFNKNRFD